MRSNAHTLDPLVRQQYDQELAYVLENKAQVPGLVRSVGNATGYTVGNVYSVLAKNTINPTVVHEAYLQICRYKGIISPDFTVSANLPDDRKGLELLSKANAESQKLMHLLEDMKNLNSTIRRTRKDILVLNAHIDVLLEFSLEDMTDEVAISLREYRRKNSQDQQEHPSQSADTEMIDPEILKAIALLKESGVVDTDGFLKEDDEEAPSEDTLTADAAEEAFLLARD